MSPRVPGRYWVEGNKATIVLLVCFSVLLISVPVAAFVLPFAGAQSVADARTEASDHLDAIVATLPAQLVRSDEQESATEEACPGNPEDEVVQIQRVVVVDPAFDKAGWLHELDRRFEDWRLSRRTLDSDGALRVSLVAPDSSFVSVQSAETEGGTEFTLISRSPCLHAPE
ncbi:hypothetical protein ACH3VR_12235 [Microbacterium sp. B2969]|uniref:Uncharacterized protein n=1 Tax=Microbacterium alkaliflavum TaxID=3248839 RepID=A0ABW7QCD5_9MICO